METGRILTEDAGTLTASVDALTGQPIDLRMPAPSDWRPTTHETTLAHEFAVTGPGTYTRGVDSTLVFTPSHDGWELERLDQPEQLPIRVCVQNVWTAKRSIVLRSGSPRNYVRMTEHIIAHRLGLGLDNVRVGTETGDPPLFNVGSMPIVEAILNAGLVEDMSRPLRYFGVREPVTLPGPNGAFLNLAPPMDGSHKLTLDVAIDFPNAIGRQRIIFDLCREAFTLGAHARTNCSRTEMLYALTLGKLFADIRNLGYTRDNILVAGARKYVNTPALIHNGKSLEAVWHRACLDLVAALSLFNRGRIAGYVTSYKAGHNLDCRMMTLLEKYNLWQELKPSTT